MKAGRAEASRYGCSLWVECERSVEGFFRPELTAVITLPAVRRQLSFSKDGGRDAHDAVLVLVELEEHDAQSDCHDEKDWRAEEEAES